MPKLFISTRWRASSMFITFLIKGLMFQIYSSMPETSPVCSQKCHPSSEAAPFLGEARAKWRKFPRWISFHGKGLIWRGPTELEMSENFEIPGHLNTSISLTCFSICYSICKNAKCAFLTSLPKLPHLKRTCDQVHKSATKIMQDHLLSKLVTVLYIPSTPVNLAKKYSSLGLANPAQRFSDHHHGLAASDEETCRYWSWRFVCALADSDKHLGSTSETQIHAKDKGSHIHDQASVVYWCVNFSTCCNVFLMAYWAWIAVDGFWTIAL